MLIRRPADIPSSEITPESVWLNRRQVLRAAAGATLLAAGVRPGRAAAAQVIEPLTAPRTAAFSTDEAANTLEQITTYNNFYEFGTGKSDPAEYAGAMLVRPWTVRVDGAVAKPRTFAIEDLLRLPLEERIYRLRCVEAWSMVIPWVGFPFSALAALVEPTSAAKYVRFVTAVQPETMPGVRTRVLDWPYQEGLRIDEAMHPLTLVAVGVYGRTLYNQSGAPLRMVIPWKYGFKGAKSLVHIEFVEQQPKTSWNVAGPSEYGFYSNVNPDVDHPRWSQRREKRLPSLFASRQTEKFNGYGAQVASLYAGMDLAKDF